MLLQKETNQQTAEGYCNILTMTKMYLTLMTAKYTPKNK